MQITPDTHVGEIAATAPGTIRVFQQYGIDFCCGGKRPLKAVCEDHGLVYEDVRRELERAHLPPDARERDWATAPLGELIDHILERYHASLKTELPRLEQMATKVADVHGARYPEMLPLVLNHVRALGTELLEHMAKEEAVLFPAVRWLEMERAERPDTSAAGLMAPIRVMEHEHEQAGRILAELREVTREYEAPPDACNTFRGLFHGLAELEGDLHAHINLENNVLFPRVLLKRHLGVTGSDRREP